MNKQNFKCQRRTVLLLAGKWKSKKKIKFPKTEGLFNYESTYGWLYRAGCNKIAILGPLIQEKASEVAKDKGFLNFKASYEWLINLKRNSTKCL